MNLYQTEIRKDSVNKKLHVTRQFQAPKEMVWKAWTTGPMVGSSPLRNRNQISGF